jgi:DNA-directed RNA polymerase specialized sigma24 family protein
VTAGEIDAAQPDDELDSWGGETDWDLIREASGRGGPVDSEKAWLELVQRYRTPVKRVLRNHLRDDAMADEAAGDFFGYLFQKQILPKADPDQGRFRCYIQGVMKRFARSWLRATTMPRAPGEAGGCDVHDIDVGADGDTGQLERDEELVWAEAILGHALEQLRRDAPGHADLLVRYYGLGGTKPVRGDVIAKKRGKKDGAVHVALHRARARLHAALLAELTPMVSTKEELEQERQFLITRLLEAHPGLELALGD